MDEESLHGFFVGVGLQGIEWPDEVVRVREMLLEEVEYHVAPLGSERRIHDELAIEVMGVGVDDGESSESIP